MSDYPFLFELLLFAGKALIFVLAVAAILLLIALLLSARRGLKAASEDKGSEVVLINLTRRQQQLRKKLQQSLKKQDPDEKLRRQEKAAAAGKESRLSFLMFWKKKDQSKEKIVARPVQPQPQTVTPPPAEPAAAEQQNTTAADQQTPAKDQQAPAAAAPADPQENQAKENQDTAAVAGAEPAENAETAEDKDQAGNKLGQKQQARREHLAAIAALRAEGVFCPRNVFVINFHGSTNGGEVKRLTVLIDALLQCADERDEAVIRLSSPGGMVNSYGLLSSQLLRIRNRGIFLTVCVDTVAASGGYLMACVANRIVAAPFAYIGSIGVVAGIPNFHRLMQKHQVDYEQVTAGRYKRTLTMLGENTEEGRAKFQQELEAIHARFKEQVQRFRPQLDMDKVATGEAWLGLDALELGLIDEIGVFEDYINKLQQRTENNVLQLTVKKKPKGLQSRLRRLFGARGLGRMLPASRLEQVQALDDPHAHIR